MYEQSLVKIIEPIKKTTISRLNRIQEEENLLEGKTPEEKKERVFKGFAEGRSK